MFCFCSLNHAVFGDVKKLITTEFVRMGYLEYILDHKADPPVYEFKWGLRAKQEISKRNAFQFVCQVRVIKKKSDQSELFVIIKGHCDFSFVTFVLFIMPVMT